MRGAKRPSFSRSSGAVCISAVAVGLERHTHVCNPHLRSQQDNNLGTDAREQEQLEAAIAAYWDADARWREKCLRQIFRRAKLPLYLAKTTAVYNFKDAVELFRINVLYERASVAKARAIFARLLLRMRV